MKTTNTDAYTAIQSSSAGLNLADVLINGEVLNQNPQKKRKTYRDKLANPTYRPDRDGHVGVFQEYKGPKGKKKWVWSGTAGNAADGTRLRKSGFASAADAKAWRDRKIAEKQGARAVVVRDLTAAETILAAAAFDTLEKAGILSARIETAIAQYIARHPTAGRDKTVAAFHAEWLAQKKQLNRRPRTIVSARSTFRPFLFALGEKQLCDVTPKDVRDIVFAAGSPRSQINRALTAANFFNEAAGLGYLGQAPEDNPCNKLKRPTAEDPIPTPWNIQEAQRILDLAWRYDANFHAIAGVATTMFAGLRTEEIFRAKYGPGGIDVGRGLITIPAAAAKKRRARVMEMEPNLRAILRAVIARAEKDGASIADGARVISVRQLRAFRKRVRESGLKWKPNGSRSAFGSHYYERCGDINRTIAAMGHTGNTTVFHAHYRGIVNPGEGTKYFALLPKQMTKQN